MPTLAGEDILASDIWRPKVIRKQATESVVNNTFQNDDDFVIALPVGIYRVEMYAHSTGVAPVGTADIQTRWTQTGTMAIVRSVMGGGTSATSVGNALMRWQGVAFGTAIQYAINASTWLIREDLEVEVSVAGTLQFQWAQFTTNATATSLSTASRMYVTQLETA